MQPSRRAVTGSNMMPLANRRQFGAGDSGTPPPEQQSPSQQPAQRSSSPPRNYSPPPRRPEQQSQNWAVVVPSTGPGGFIKNGRFDAQAYSNGVKRVYEGSAPSSTGRENDDREGRPRKRKNRWGDSEAKVNIPGLPTTLPSGLSKEQMDMYQIHLRLEEISRKLRTNDVVPPDGERSPSPPPIYGPDGKRANTREIRYRTKLENERHRLVERGMKLDVNFRPPGDYKRPSKMQDKVYIPTREFPEINFIGLLIGPRGNTLKKLESDSGAKVSIRGKGSVKEGKQSTAASMNEEEDLHCLVSADSEDKVTKAVQLIYKVIETASNVPEGENELKRMQLRELAALNGTLRDDENQACLNCGAIGHRKYDCPEQRNFTINLQCRICGNAGHMARDCMYKNDPEMLRGLAEKNKEMDSEIGKFMEELGGGQGGPGADGIEPSGHYGPGRAAPAAVPWKTAATESAPWKTAAAPPAPTGGAPGGWPPGGMYPSPAMAGGMYPSPAMMGGYPQQGYGMQQQYGMMQQPPPPPMDMPAPPPPSDLPPPPPED